jgi:hypothetical protein
VSRKLTDVAIGIAGALVVFAAVPSVLALLVGDPLPTHWTRGAVVSLHGLFELLTVVAWCAWATCAWLLLRSVVDHVRTRDTSHTPRLFDQLAVRIAVVILAIAPAGIASVGGTAGATTRPASAATAPPAGRVTTAASGGHGNTSPTATGAEHPIGRWHRASAAHGGTAMHLVVAGESLSQIADRWYGEGSAWNAIAAANLGRLMADGTRFVDPAHPRAGWQLAMPSLAPTSLISSLHPDISSSDANRRGRDPSGSAPAPLPELGALGVGSLVAALLARRARQQRKRRSLTRPERDPTPAPQAADVALVARLAPFEHSPLLEWVEVGLCQLTVAARAADTPLPALAWLRVGSAGLDVHFRADPPRAPAPWMPAGPARWRLPASAYSSRALVEVPLEPCCPVVLPVGDDADATWLLPIAPGASLAVLGPLAGTLIRAMQVAVSRWRWADGLVVTADVDAAVAAADSPGPWPAVPTTSPHVLFVGDHRALPEGVRARIAVLTAEISDEATTSVLVDHRAATLHPFGVSLRPHLLADVWAEPIAQVAPSASGGPARRCDDPPQHRPSALRHRAGPSATARVARLADPSALGPVHVRLLTSVPRIDGLHAALPANRARRAVELIAYLAIHWPDPVTGDRLRTRVLGSADTDPTTKTLFNIVHAARRALGLAPDGTPLLPPPSRAGHYQISSLVTVDARRAAASLEDGLASGDIATSLSLIEHGLALVEGEPLGGVLTGYGWWRAEGHERRLADIVVDGACALVRGAISAGEIDRARWAIAVARQVESYSEALTRAAMVVAAASGDAVRLHAEWLDCRRQVDELDPGGTPTLATERLYVHLRAQLGVDGRRRETTPART